MSTQPWVMHGNRLMPQRYIDISNEITLRHPNLYLVEVDGKHNPGEHPFGIAIDNGDEPDEVVKYLSEVEMSLEYILNWLRENDASNEDIDHFAKFMADYNKHEADIKKANAERTAESADLLASIATSNLHTYRINGRKLGAENNFPTIQPIEKD